MKPAHAPVDALTDSLRALLPVLQAQWRAPWCVIGSAALRLLGVQAVQPQDIDLLCSAADAERLARHWSGHREASYAPADGARFRSRFARYRGLPLPVEVMGDLQVHVDGAWQDLPIPVITWVDCHGVRVPVPTPAEQARILHLFGRPKDLAKAAQLQHLLAGTPRHAC